MKRELFDASHELFRDTVRRFIAAEIAPHHAQWERDGVVPRELWRRAGAAGLLGCAVPEAYGGAGADMLYNVVLVEEMARAGMTGPAFSLHCEIVMPYLLRFGTEAQKQQWLPRMVRGEAIGAIGMTEPGAGSDLRSLRTRAVRVKDGDGDHYVIDGQKVFISNGQLCDLLILAARTGAEGGNAGADGLSLFLVESSRPGFRRGRNLEKIGLKAQDTSELFFDGLRVPASNLLGQEGEGFRMLTANLVQERLTQAVRSAATAEAVFEWTRDYVAERRLFGRTLAEFQHTQFKLAELKTDITVGRVFTDRCIANFLRGELGAAEAAMVKMWLSNLHVRVVDECLQMFGGWGYMWEQPIARAWADARHVRIAGGSIETMKSIIAKTLFPKERPS